MDMQDAIILLAKAVVEITEKINAAEKEND